MVLHGNRKERREELDAQREMERLTGFSGIVAEEPADGQGASVVRLACGPAQHSHTRNIRRRDGLYPDLLKTPSRGN